MRTVFAAVCLLALANAAFAQKGVYVPANIVPSWDQCPVKNPAVWDPKVFDPSLDSLTKLADFTANLSKSCQDSLVNLANCASDNDAFATPPSTITSLSTSNGCCLTDCSNSIKEVISNGCFNELLKTICGNPQAAAYQTGLFNAGVRCANLQATCPGTGGAAAATNGTASAAAKNATAAIATPVEGAANATRAAVANATTTVTTATTGGSTTTRTNGAGAAAASAAAVLLGAAALLVL